jgi:phospholipase/carboxylesterase
MAELPLEHVHVAPDGDPANDPDERTNDPDERTNDPDDPATAPAVFVLHGRGADEEDLLPVANALPDDLHVVSLRAPDRLQGGYTWYELDLSGGGLHESQPHAGDFRRSLDRVVESVEAAVGAYDLDADRLGLLGFSQGAITSLAAVLESPERYAWVVALHGYLPDSHVDLDPDGIAGKPAFVGAGTGDRVIPDSRSAAAAERLSAVGADVTYETYPVGHGIDEAELADVVAFVETNG